jgi:ABC-type dipeptide/oligopeptide/nickel transport system permease subunit
MVGLFIVLGLFLLALFGPMLAPKNPYIAGQHIVPHFDFQRQEYVRPPLPPSPEFPLGTDRWGNDLLSLMMHGARNTLVACAFITMVRLILGLILGGLAGWNEGKTFDHAIMGIVVVITSVPMLISSIILIYALDIRKGLPVFIVALAVIGWAEIAQYIRSEFLVLRKRPYIEGARATGLNGLEIAVRHVLPNVLPQLLVITFLEMGAVMMLMGELGFVGVFIGGGSRIAMFADPLEFDPVTTMGVPDVPEWGAILAEGFRLLRWRPFVVFPPAVAFFVAVLGFNALGEGLRRLIEQSGLSTGFLLRKRMLLVIGGLTLATVFIMNNTGPAPWFTKVAEAYKDNLAYEQVRALAAMEGRGAGQAGGEEAAAYIVEKFEAYGLEPGGPRDRYIYSLETLMVKPLDQPSLALVGTDGQPLQEFRHQIDFGFMIEGHGGNGEIEAPLTFVGFESEPTQYDWESFKGLDLRGRIVLLLQGNAPPDFATEALIRGAQGVLWVAGEGRDDVRSQVQLADPAGAYLRRPNMPIFRIRPSAASAMLEQDGILLSDLLLPDVASQDMAGSQTGSDWFTRDLNATVRMSLRLSEPQTVEIPCVLGYKIGSDFDLSGQLIVLFAAYDGLGMDPDGTVYPAANHNASSVGMLLELARVWHEQELNARRTVLFVAWGAGQLDDSGVREFLNDSRNFPLLSTRSLYSGFAPAIIIQPDYVGAGGDTLFIYPDSDERLTRLLTESLSEVGVSVTSEMSNAQPYDELVSGRRTRWLHFAWSDADTKPDQDVIERIEATKLQALGEALSLVLTQIVRQSSY